MKRTKGDSRLIVLAFMAAAALLSSVMSDTAAVLMFIGFAKGILDALGCKPLKSNFGRCLFIGFCTPPSSAASPRWRAGRTT